MPKASRRELAGLRGVSWDSWRSPRASPRTSLTPSGASPVEPGPRFRDESDRSAFPKDYRPRFEKLPRPSEPAVIVRIGRRIIIGRSLPAPYADWEMSMMRRVCQGLRVTAALLTRQHYPGVAMGAGEASGAGRRARDGNAAALGLDHMIELRGVSRRQAHAAMRSRPSQSARGVCAVDGVAAAKENRVRHWRHVVFFGIMHALEPGRRITAARCAIPRAGGRDRPSVAPARRLDSHRLRAQIDVNLRRGPRRRERAQHAEKNDEYSFCKTHDPLPTPC